MGRFKDLSGVRFGKLVAQSPIRKKGLPTKWVCLCDCGRTSNPSGVSLTRGMSQSCGCARSENIKKEVSFKDVSTGDTFGWLTIKDSFMENKRRKVIVICKCGAEKKLNLENLLRYPEGASCGCRQSALHKETIEKDLLFLGKPNGRFKLGDIRENGDIFLSCKGGRPIWMKPARFQEYTTKEKIRTLIKISIKGNFKKSKKTEPLLCCSLETARNYIASQFKEGMSWDNHGEWEIDHVIPISYAKNQEDAEMLCHYSNLQPLWWEENLSKKDKLPDNVEELFLALKSRVLEYKNS